MHQEPDLIISRKFKIAFLGVALLGFMDAAYLTTVHYLHIIPPCYIVKGCETVTTSGYSFILGIPVALLGAFYYLTIFSMVLYYVDKRAQWILPWIARVTILGFLFSLWFIYVQGFIINEWCMYCIFSAWSSSADWSPWRCGRR